MKKSESACFRFITTHGPISLPNDEFRQAIYRLHQTKLTLNDGLCILKQIFPERIVILPSAWKSAAEAARFERTPQAFDLLWKLVTDYWEMLVAGQGNHVARQIFGDDFAATESETVQHNTRARRLRTFSYNGQEIEMLMHLRLGRKESIAQTWRTHFTWDAERKVIVIGHCGKHLDHD
ncbi:hypothetical protein F8S13_27380 [Chloroflexia bacterium SDU3-3]|nr:hypothetical protein F8S13_27380 [Chloroflexia bacterium SDU3-3]